MQHWKITIEDKMFDNLEPGAVQYAENAGQREFAITIDDLLFETFPPVIKAKIEIIQDDGSSTVLLDDYVYNYHIAISNGKTFINLIKNK